MYYFFVLIFNFNNFLYFREEKDARVAAQIAERLEKEEEARRKLLEEHDKQIARRLLVGCLNITSLCPYSYCHFEILK